MPFYQLKVKRKPQDEPYGFVAVILAYHLMRKKSLKTAKEKVQTGILTTNE